MKTLALLLLSSLVFACPKGTFPYEGTCAADLKPEGADTQAPTTDPKIVSAEKPSRHPEPAYLRGEVHADMPPSCASTGKCSDQEAIDAAAQGKKAAGVPDR